MFALNVLAVSADHRIQLLLDNVFAGEGHRVRHAANDTEALLALGEDFPADLVIRDFPRRDWCQRLQAADYLRFVDPAHLCVLLDAGDSAFRQFAAQIGVKTILTKPLLRQDLDALITNLIPKLPELEGCSPFPASHPGDDIYIEELPNGKMFLAGCPAMRQIIDDIRLLAPVDVPVLILGESGVGKEIISMLLHKHSLRSQRPFTNVNCAALPTDLLESELFGYEAGAFTGAVKAKPGKFEQAHKGTILLDEIGEMSAPMQAKLLHVLQDGQFSRLGARSATQVDVRVLAATNINMEQAIEEKRFREDLFYRLNAFPIFIPPLRERREEIPALLRETFRRQAIELGRPMIEVSNALLEAAQAYAWPGNLRELRNYVTRILVLGSETSALADLRSKTRAQRESGKTSLGPQPPQNMNEGMRSVVREVKDQTEMKMIQEALLASGWNRRRAAANLHISYRSLLYKIQQYGLSPSSYRPNPYRPTMFT